MRIDKLRSMEYFVRVAEAKSFAAAAKSLNISASAMSKVVGALEKDLGFILFLFLSSFERHDALLHPTPQ